MAGALLYAIYVGHLSLQLPFCALQVFDEQVLACELVVVWEVVDALPIMQVDLIKFMMNPSVVHANMATADSSATTCLKAVMYEFKLAAVLLAW
jgi:hypothetical protein